MISMKPLGQGDGAGRASSDIQLPNATRDVPPAGGTKYSSNIDKDKVGDLVKADQQGRDIIGTSRLLSVRKSARGQVKASRQKSAAIDKSKVSEYMPGNEENVVGMSLAKKSLKKNGINQIRIGTSS